MKNKRRIIGIVAATLLASMGTVSLMAYAKSAKDKAESGEALVDVYVVDELVPKGAEPETIKSSVSLEQVPARLKQSGAITDLDAVGLNVAAIDLQPGDQLLAARLVAKEAVSDDVADKVQVAALLEAERAVGGALQKGDLVGVYLSFDPFELDAAGESSTADETTGETTAGGSGDQASAPDSPQKSPNLTRLEFQHVLVTNVQTINPPVSPDDNEETGVAQVTGTQYVVTLALSPEQSERFVFATEFGHVRLSLDPTTVTDDGTRPVTLGNVYTAVK